MTKPKVQAYLSRDLHKRFLAYVEHGKGRTQSSVMEAALTAYFDDATDTDTLYRRLDRQSRQIGKVIRDQEVLSEAFAVFVKLWFAHTPRIPESDRDDAQTFAAGRFAQYVEHVGRAFASGSRFVDDLATDLPSAVAVAPSRHETTEHNSTEAHHE